MVWVGGVGSLTMLLRHEYVLSMPSSACVSKAYSNCAGLYSPGPQTETNTAVVHVHTAHNIINATALRDWANVLIPLEVF